MTDKKRRIEISFDEAEFAILEELAQGSQWSIEKIIYDTIHHAHFTEAAKQRHAAARRLLAMEPLDWGADWSELKEWLANHRAWETLKSYEQDPGIAPRDAIHSAVVMEHGLDGIVSADRDSDRIPALRRYDPADPAAAHIPGN